MKKLLLLVFIIGCSLILSAAEQEIKSVHLVGVCDEGRQMLFRIVNGSFNATFSLPYNEFSSLASRAGIMVCHNDAPENVILSMSGIFADEVLKADGTGSFILKTEIRPEVWDARKISMDITWEGREVEALDVSYFEITQTLEAWMPGYELVPAEGGAYHREYTGMELQSCKSVLRLDVLKKIDERDLTAFHGRHIAVGKTALDDERKAMLTELDRRLTEAGYFVEASELKRALPVLEDCLKLLHDYKSSWGTRIRVLFPPGEKLMLEHQALVRQQKQLREQQKMAIINNDKTLKMLKEQRINFSASVVRMMLSSFIGWQGNIADQPADALGKQSLSTGIFDLPRSLLYWQTNAASDPDLLRNQKNAIVQLEIYERFWAELRDKSLAELETAGDPVFDQDMEKFVALYEALDAI